MSDDRSIPAAAAIAPAEADPELEAARLDELEAEQDRLERERALARWRGLPPEPDEPGPDEPESEPEDWPDELDRWRYPLTRLGHLAGRGRP